MEPLEVVVESGQVVRHNLLRASIPCRLQTVLERCDVAAMMDWPICDLPLPLPIKPARINKLVCTSSIKNLPSHDSRSLPMKRLVRVLPHWWALLIQPKLSHHSLRLVVFNKPHAYEWAAHTPEPRLLRALMVEVRHPRANTVVGTIWLPFHLQKTNSSEFTTCQ
jgi:hypothetical protein